MDLRNFYSLGLKASSLLEFPSLALCPAFFAHSLILLATCEKKLGMQR